MPLLHSVHKTIERYVTKATNQPSIMPTVLFFGSKQNRALLVLNGNTNAAAGEYGIRRDSEILASNAMRFATLREPVIFSIAGADQRAKTAQFQRQV